MRRHLLVYASIKMAASTDSWVAKIARGSVRYIYVEELGYSFSKPTVKQHLAAVRMLFDWLVTGQVIRTNPAHSVRGPKHVVKRGKTPILVTDQARAILESTDTLTLHLLRPDGRLLWMPRKAALAD